MAFRRVLNWVLGSGLALFFSACVNPIREPEALSSTQVTSSVITIPTPVDPAVEAAAYCAGVSTAVTQCQSLAATGFSLRLFHSGASVHSCYCQDSIVLSGSVNTSLLQFTSGSSGSFGQGTLSSIPVTVTNVSQVEATNCHFTLTNPPNFTISTTFIEHFLPGTSQALTISVTPFSGEKRATHIQIQCENTLTLSGVYSAAYVTLYRAYNVSTNKHITTQSASGEGSYAPDMTLGRVYSAIPTGSSASDFAQICRCVDGSGHSFTTTDLSCEGVTGFTSQCFNLDGNPVYVHKTQGTGEIPLYRMISPLNDSDHMDALNPNEAVTGFQQIVSSDGHCLDLDQGSGATTANGTSVMNHSCNAGPTNNQLWKLDSVTYSGETYSKAVTRLNLYKVFDVADVSTPLFSVVHLWDYLGKANQLWKLVPVSGTNKVQFKSANDLNKCLYSGASTGNQYFIYTCSTSISSDQFTLIPEWYGSDRIPGSSNNIIGYILPQ